MSNTRYDGRSLSAGNLPLLLRQFIVDDRR